MASEAQVRRDSIERLLVVRLGSMGDIVHTLPAVAVLRCALPEATIGWAVEERWSELLCARGTPLAGPRSAQRPLVDRVHVVNTLAWRRALLSSGTRREFMAAVRGIRAAKYEVAIDFQGAIKSSFLAQRSGAAVRVGFARPRERVAALFYTRQVAAGARHIVEQNLSLAEEVRTQAKTGPGRSSRLEFPLPHDAAAEAWCKEELRRRGLQKFAIINPGAGWGAKCWPAERYAEVARALGAQGLKSVVNIGPGEEVLGRDVQASSGGAAQTIVCTVGQLIALARRAQLFVGGDTGPLHLAAALGVPVVAIYGPTDPERNGPMGSPSVVLRHASSETSHHRHAQTEAGLLNVTADEVIEAARRLMAEARA